MDSRHRHGVLFIFATQIIWGLTPIVIKFINHGFPGSLLVAIRGILGAVLLFAIIIASGTFKSVLALRPKMILQLVLLGIVASGIADLFNVAAIRNGGVIVATLMARLEIPLGVMMASWILKEKISSSMKLATALSFVGVVLISYRTGLTAQSSASFYQGIFYGLFAALCWSSSGIFAKTILSKKVLPIVVTCARLFVGGIFSAVMAATTVPDIAVRFSQLTSTEWGAIVGLGIVASALAFYLYYEGLERLEANRTAVLLSLSLVVAVLSGILIGESLQLVQWCGAAFILMGIYITITSPKTQQPAAELLINES